MNKYGKLIGSGNWSKAYRLPNSDYVTIVTNDTAKESLYRYTYSNIHIPTIEYIDTVTLRGQDYKVYTMPFYDKLVMSQLCEQDAKDLRTIRKYIKPKGNGYWWTYGNYNELADMVDSWEIQDSLKEGLNNLLSSYVNYHYNMGLEFMPRNLKMKDNRIILLDVIYSMEQF